MKVMLRQPRKSRLRGPGHTHLTPLRVLVRRVIATCLGCIHVCHAQGWTYVIDSHATCGMHALGDFQIGLSIGYGQI